MSERKRLFFAISLPEESSTRIVAWRAQSFAREAGRPIASANLHLTLAFPGDVSHERSLALQRLAAKIKQPGFVLTLDDAGHWPRSGIVWLGPKRSPRGLLQLAEMLRAQAARCGCYQSPGPFHPHITLLRNAIRPVALPPRNFHWSFYVERFSLFESVFPRGHTVYKALAEWNLEKETR
ncbi:RNA 2',3'-cyclic phosphodiesterase [Erwinia tracheiphila]|uniref:RNA 2',3'-cyclic phosphodiesterase n=1 Tax=Erwinia tracheiphila TaxID=65700 RepID=A0A345CYD8_9GAMM|nr:RNA 2',3'-cyclic phosphodiesterase [Erwinia tracheiphila]AXF78455.1 RNA 2',3'-cyclic phosphodiesterase [Erwinia tracheiphila]UIA82812.1 RNA 2',3'-cyclic phosphodiesterase [Erwinia tracheiphila]UIA91399.1 RNA 2',3'-cyclic phosphodiesterase [Erwinia tracheiphila]